jgi:hypothetical protein
MHNLIGIRGMTIAIAGLLWTGPAPAAERFLVYKVERIEAKDAPVVDGRLDEPAWADKAAVTVLRHFNGKKKGELASQPSAFTVLTDGKMLYLGMTFFESDMARLKWNPAQPPFWNDCTELYFDPRHDGTRSIQLVVDCGNQKTWMKKFDDGYGWWNDVSWYMLAQWSAATALGRDRWTIEIAIDCASFGIDPTPGKVCGFNPCRFRICSEPQEFTCWGFDRFIDYPAQKMMPSWGHLVFAEPGVRTRNLPVTAREVALVYPDLGDRVLEVPTEDGFTIFSRDGERRVKFADLLAPAMAELSASLQKARQALETLPADNPNRARIKAPLDQLATEAGQLHAEAGVARLTLGAYDQLADRLARVKAGLDEQGERAKLARIAFEAGAGP